MATPPPAGFGRPRRLRGSTPQIASYIKGGSRRAASRARHEPPRCSGPDVNLSLSDRHALVCGASAGIGRAAALALAAQGAEVTALARRGYRLDALVGELVAAGAPRARSLVADLDDRMGLAALLDGLLEDAGPVHVVLNNTGGPAAGPILDAGVDELAAAFGRHVLAAQLILQRVLPGMRAAGYGRIINVVSSSVREPIDGLGVSNTTRGAMAAWAKSVSRELPPGVTINSILPGKVDTERLGEIGQVFAARSGTSVERVRAGWLAEIPEGRLGRPEELAAVVAFLASPAAAFVRGVALPVDGGQLRSI